MVNESFYHSTLIETGNGFQYTFPPQLNLLSSSNLYSNNPWITICSVLEHLKQGDFSKLEHLTNLMKKTDAADIWDGCEVLLSYAAPYSLMSKMVKDFEREIFQDCHIGVQAHISRLLARSMNLEYIPIILDIYQLIDSQDQLISLEKNISFTLEEEDSTIYEGPKYKRIEEDYGLGNQIPEFLKGETKLIYDTNEYVRIVSQIYTELKNKYVYKENISIFEGNLFSVKAFLKKLLNSLRKNKNTERISVSRMVFEATTGKNCNDFYKDGVLQPIAAVAIVEDFLESGEVEKYESGVRYFFGHRIPD
jgi:hypothetical protein